MTTSEVVVRELLIYPIKSCAPIKVQEALTTRYGLSFPSNHLLSDRRWMVIHGTRRRDQLQLPRMALIQPLFTASSLQITAPGMQPLTIPYDLIPDDIIQLEDPAIKGRKYGGEIAAWFQKYLEKPGLDLVYFDESFEPQKTKYLEMELPNDALESDGVAYQDMCPFHLASLESMDDLNKLLENPLPIHNFRPNIIVSGVDGPYSEDYWREIQIGNHVKLRWIRSCLRCLLPTVDQETGIRDPSQEPWKTLQTYRRKPELYGTKAGFGIYLGTLQDGIIRVGDGIKILKENRNF